MKLEDERNPQFTMAREIISYWLERPDAKDTIEGIQKWWLLRKNVPHRKRADVQGALDSLTSKGWLIKREIAPSTNLYGINPDRIDEIKAFLRGSEAPEPEKNK